MEHTPSRDWEKDKVPYELIEDIYKDCRLRISFLKRLPQFVRYKYEWRVIIRFF